MREEATPHLYRRHAKSVNLFGEMPEQAPVPIDEVMPLQLVNCYYRQARAPPNS
jgi:hypothetical protein